MTLLRLRLIFVVLGLAILLPTGAAKAQSSDCGGVEQNPCPKPKPPTNVGGGGPSASGESLNTGYTRTLVKLIEGANRTCDERILLRYRIDCLRIYYQEVADRLPDTGEYLPIKKAMQDAADKLDAIVEANLDPTAPEIRPREGHKPAAKRIPPVRAVKEENAASAAAQAAAVVEEVELIILRSGGDPARRSTHYNAVAAAVESNLVVLRSA